MIKSTSKTNEGPLSADEIAVLSELQKHSNNNIETIAKNCGFSRQKVGRIIKKLEENKIIWGYTTIFEVEHQALQKFLLLIKRTMNVVDETTIENIIFARSEKEYQQIGVTIESSYYIHGEYDWALIFTAKDLKHAKKFSSILSGNYADIIQKTVLMQILYAQRNHYIINPNLAKLKEFI